ncbi:MAG: holo-ACP synthase [Alkalibacterium sp.]|uniref:Holo-[acyl-carrier-protein] synthase n=1 Tax=Alkalibacterium gilvum TaxID=1130080 RepID=A0A1H6SCI9_9LACT|nr:MULTISPECIES: holo-ACP synthase [Alkalibacterium]MDN6194779.1 holo-ACP synthase [Alkalibacterium sp.]MDN6293588.1 holo-ACP synthase [Alkalibacterium sp.]MDN6295299.1 holo-ACP synthase [Alkalibacterium sp.]MDN6327045.1 holo-ACP synthase [Alkalibacterium sp.]MDN6385654.1 holo-ACP synthase [Alkalibacterium sp.]
MIVGIGLDVVEIDRIKKAYIKNKRFAHKVLTNEEFKLFSGLKGKRQYEFLAGRFSVKEAFAKAMGTGIGKVSFLDVELLPDPLGKPIVTQSPFKGNVWVSITHTDNLAASQVILEKS